MSKKLLKTIGKTNAQFRLIGEGDRVLIGLSGGKDSLALIHALKHIQQHAPFDFEFEACTINYGMPNEHYTALETHTAQYGIKHTVFQTNIYTVSNDTIRENSSFCSYFSRMRRGALYSYAQEHGFNKIALGHHFDDAVESFFMNMFYNGSMRSMAPIYKTERGFHLIQEPLQVTINSQPLAMRRVLRCSKMSKCPTPEPTPKSGFWAWRAKTKTSTKCSKPPLNISTTIPFWTLQGGIGMIFKEIKNFVPSYSLEKTDTLTLSHGGASAKKSSTTISSSSIWA